MMSQNRVFYLLIIVLFSISFIIADEIASDDFECDGFNCGNGWNNDWQYVGDCIITSLTIPRGSFHLRGQESGGVSCVADRNFDNSLYSISNLTFWAKSRSLESNDFCRYYYFDGSAYNLLLEMANGDDNDPYREYSFNVTQYGTSTNASIRIRQFGVGADNCFIDDINITGTGLIGPDTTSPIINSAIENSNPVIINTSIIITANISDNIAVNSTTIEINSINFSMIQLSTSSNTSEIFFIDDFESGSLNTNNWNFTGIEKWGVSILDPANGTYHAQVQQTGAGDPSYMEVNITTESHRNLTLSYYRKLISLDAADDFAVEWFDGTSWNVLEQLGAATENNANYVFKIYNLSTNANYNPNFKIRFMCEVGAVTEYCRVDNITLEGVLSSSDDNIWQYTYEATSLGIQNYTIYANDTSGNNATPLSQNFSVIESNITISEIVRDSSNNALNVTIEIEDINNITVYNQTTISHNINLPKGRYKIKIRPKNHSIKEIKFDGLNFTNDINSIVDIDDPTNNLGYNELVSVNPLLQNNTENDTYTVTMIAKNTSRNKILYKCGNWNFTSQNCSGNWTAWMTIFPGQQYNATFLFGDPGMGEGNGTFFEGFETGSLSTNNWETSGALKWTIAGKAEDRFAGLKYVNSKNTGGVEDILQVNISTAGYENIVFDFYYKTKDMGSGDYIAADWYNGTDWTQILNTQGSTVWTLDSNTLGNDANNNSNFKIRFRCLNNAGSETCYLDNIEINGDEITASTPPTFSNITESPANASIYSSNQYYEFNVTVTDNATDEVGIEFNGVNYTSVSNISDLYSFNQSDLPAGDHTYYWWANDTSGNFNASVFQTYTINKSSTTTIIISTPTSPIIYGTSNNFSCSNNVGPSVILYIDGADKSSENHLNIIRSANTAGYNVTCITNSNQNYTTSSDNTDYIINRATPNGTLSGSSSIIYGATGTVNATEANSGDADLSYILYRGDVQINNPDTEILAASTYNYVYNTTGGENYSLTTSLDTFVLEVNKTGPSTNMQIVLTPSDTVDYGIQTTATASETNTGDADLVYNLFRDDNGVANPNVMILPNAGNYTYIYNTTGGGNYTSGAIIEVLTINPAPDTTPPNITIINPQDGETFGFNESLTLNFTVNDSSGVDSCWYNIDDGVNNTLTSCQNTTFNISINGNYVLNLFANDTAGNENSTNVNFTIEVVAPNITLNFPVNVDINYSNVEFNYTPIDINLDTCELWGDFSGTFGLNQSNSSPISGQINNFNINLFDGSYLWGVKCNDTFIDSTTTANTTFLIDTIIPSLTILEPTGTKTSRTLIPLNFVATDINLDLCWYNVFQGASQHVSDTFTNCSTSTTFNVSVDADFILNFYTNDSAGNINYTNISFSVNTGISPPPPIIPSGGGSGGGGSAVILNKTGKIEVEKINNIIAHLGDAKPILLKVGNTGKIFLNNCRILATGEIRSWIYSDQIKGIAPGEKTNFIFNINIPQEIESGDHFGELTLNCNEASKIQELIISIPYGPKFIEINNIVNEEEGLNIIYTINNTDSIGEEISVDIWITDEEENEIKRTIDVFGIINGELLERNILIELPRNTIGVYTVYFALSTELENYIKQTVVIGETRVTGRTVFDTARGKIIIYSIFIVVIVIGVFFIFRRYWGKAKRIRKKVKIKGSRRMRKWKRKS